MQPRDETDEEFQERRTKRVKLHGVLAGLLRKLLAALPPVPETPLGLNRTCWEHVMRIFEQCDRNVTHAAQRLGMHRRSLQRKLSKFPVNE